MLDSRIPILDETFVSLDLETTGLDPNVDQIIEIGAVKFCGHEILGTFETYIDPHMLIPKFIERLTGINQNMLENAPVFLDVTSDLTDFLGEHPIIAHNVAFDMRFLSTKGLRLTNKTYDTWDLASVFLPRAMDYSLPILSKKLGIDPGKSHRALDDAQTTRQLFLELIQHASKLDRATIHRIISLSRKSGWNIGDLIQSLEPSASGSGLYADFQSLEEKLKKGNPRSGDKKTQELLDEQDMRSLVSSSGLMAQSFPGFEYRPQQESMVSAVTKALNEGRHLIVEGATGVGKSIAYLLPSMLYAAKNDVKVVVSTNTINLQEQLLEKDIPKLKLILECSGLIDRDQIRAVSLKGRGNYLCVRRWEALSSSDQLSVDEARLLSKCLVWMQTTETGDRSEINLTRKDRSLWSRLSAGDKGKCPGLKEGDCFLRLSRQRSESADIIVVNHALLLSDLAHGGGLIPTYDHLVIDEAHHIEDEATRQLGLQVSQEWGRENLDSLERLLMSLLRLQSGPVFSDTQREYIRDVDTKIKTDIPKMLRSWDDTWSLIYELMASYEREFNFGLQLRITQSVRKQPKWDQLEISWDNCSINLDQTQMRIERLIQYLEDLDFGKGMGLDLIISDLDNVLEGIIEIRNRMNAIVGANNDHDNIHWITKTVSGALTLNVAPLDIAPHLKSELINQKSSVIFTSATLGTEGNFDFIRQRLGLDDVDELMVGSPFDYRNAILLALPTDIPDPGASGYKESLVMGLDSISRAIGGHTLVLFTSHASLREIRERLINLLEPNGIRVIAQGLDGPPQRVIQQFIDNPKSILLGTSSFWEGVDMPEGILKALVIARLPFNVPTEPTFAARSEQFEEPFKQYAVPQAVLRFRQGFGRLMRRTKDSGIVVIMDHRVTSKSYGRMFLDSLPECTVRTESVQALTGVISKWINMKK